MSGLRVSTKFGVNPTLGLCRFCGEETGEIGLLGANYKEHGLPAQAPKHMVISNEPCDKCKERFNTGWLFFIGDCGHAGFVKKEALPKSATDEIGEGKIFRMDRCFKCGELVAD